MQISKYNILYQQNEEQKNVIISTDPEKVFDQIHHFFLIRTFTIIDVEGTYNVNMIKTYDKSAVVHSFYLRTH
jgi:hypothetical protein